MGDELVVAEVSVSYDGSPPMFGVSILEFRGDKVTRERIYVMDGWEALPPLIPFPNRRQEIFRSRHKGMDSVLGGL